MENKKRAQIKFWKILINGIFFFMSSFFIDFKWNLH